MKLEFILSVLLIVCGASGTMRSQATSTLVDPLLQQHLEPSSVVREELRQFMLTHVPPLVLPSDGREWDAAASKMRTQELATLYSGWPQPWITSSPRFEKTGVIEAKGYRIVKLRYEVVPGLYSVALMYLPEHMAGKVPAILDVSGHGSGGIAAEHIQKRCINQARRGIIALSTGWFDFGELDVQGNAHDYLGMLDLAGVNGAGLFYLAIRRGLDFLAEDPRVDASRLGVTGLSGGGWQTIMLSSLDLRVKAAVPVAGFSSLTTSIEHPEYAGDDPEQNASDFRRGVDYAQLIAMRAPRPTLLIYNDMDDCCFRAGVVKQGVYSDIKPFFSLYGKPGNLQWRDNQDPGTHNYGIESREWSYQFFDTVFHLNASSKEDADTDTAVRSYSDLLISLPADNLTILSLAQSFAKGIHYEIPAQPDAQWQRSQRTQLREVSRYAPVTVTHAWVVDATHQKHMVSHSYRFQFSNGLSATGVLFRSVSAPETSAATVLVSDSGMASATDDVVNDVTRGQRVLVLSPLFFGQNVPGSQKDPQVADFAQMLNALGERPLGIEAAQVNAVVRWLGKNLDDGSSIPHSFSASPVTAARPVRIITTGPRSQTVAMVAAAIEPELFSQLDARQSIPSLMELFNQPRTYFGANMNEAPDLMCFGLYRDFDFSTLAAIAKPVKVNLSATKPQVIVW